MLCMSTEIRLELSWLRLLNLGAIPDNNESENSAVMKAAKLVIDTTVVLTDTQ